MNRSRHTKVFPDEHAEQAKLCKWLQIKNIEYAAVPNGMFINLKGRSAGMIMAKMKEEGFRTGFPDIMVLLPGRVVFIEMKRVSKSRVSDEQKEWNAKLRTLGFDAYICKGFEAAASVIEDIIAEELRKQRSGQEVT